MARSLRTRPVRPTDWAYAISPVDDSPIFYESTGVPTGLLGDLGPTPILLCDGIGCDGYVWRRLRPALTDCRVLHPHYRGHGRTAAPRDPTRVAIADLADDMVAVLDDARVDQAVLCGHSMGVQVALETRRRHPGRGAGLILIFGAPGNPLRKVPGPA